MIQLKNRFRELADKSYTRNVYTFTGFLSLAEQEVFWQSAADMKYVASEFWGGSDFSERKILRFGSAADLGYEEPYPIVCVRIRPVISKFADTFSHRDFLGAFMSLGIERSTIGDIYVTGKEGYCYCLQTMAEFICENLTKVKHTHVICEKIECRDIYIEEEPEWMEVTVASERVDGVIAKIYNMSRSSSLDLFREKKIYINGRLKEHNSICLKDNDVVTVRGYGKFIYKGMKYRTKKDKLCICVQVYK